MERFTVGPEKGHEMSDADKERAAELKKALEDHVAKNSKPTPEAQQSDPDDENVEGDDGSKPPELPEDVFQGVYDKDKPFMFQIEDIFCMK